MASYLYRNGIGGVEAAQRALADPSSVDSTCIDCGKPGTVMYENGVGEMLEVWFTCDQHLRERNKYKEHLGPFGTIKFIGGLYGKRAMPGL